MTKSGRLYLIFGLLATSVALNFFQFNNHEPPEATRDPSAFIPPTRSLSGQTPPTILRWRKYETPGSQGIQENDVTESPTDEDPVRVRLAGMEEAIEEADSLLSNYASSFPEGEGDQISSYVRQFRAPIAMNYIAEHIETLPPTKRLERMGEEVRVLVADNVHDFDGRAYGSQYGPMGSERIQIDRMWTYQDFLDVYDGRRGLVAQDLKEVSEHLPSSVYEALRYRTLLRVEQQFFLSLGAARLVAAESKADDGKNNSMR